MAGKKKSKRCMNPECERCTGKYRYKSTDNFCTICGTPLEFAEEDGRLYGGKLAGKVKEAAHEAAPKVVAGAKKIAKNPKVKKAAGVAAIAALDGAKSAIRNPKIRKVAAEVIKVIK